MRLHTNKLEWRDLHTALNAAKAIGLVDSLIQFETSSEHGSRSHARAFEIQLGWYGDKVKGDGRRFKNSGSHGSSNVYAATYDEWGWFIKELFVLDPELTFGSYKGLEAFNNQTKWAYL